MKLRDYLLEEDNSKLIKKAQRLAKKIVDGTS